jgi:hypothetical protein
MMKFYEIGPLLEGVLWSRTLYSKIQPCLVPLLEMICVHFATILVGQS